MKDLSDRSFPVASTACPGGSRLSGPGGSLHHDNPGLAQLGAHTLYGTVLDSFVGLLRWLAPIPAPPGKARPNDRAERQECVGGGLGNGRYIDKFSCELVRLEVQAP